MAETPEIAVTIAKEEITEVEKKELEKILEKKEDPKITTLEVGIEKEKEKEKEKDDQKEKEKEKALPSSNPPSPNPPSSNSPSSNPPSSNPPSSHPPASSTSSPSAPNPPAAPPSTNPSPTTSAAASPISAPSTSSPSSTPSSAAPAPPPSSMTPIKTPTSFSFPSNLQKPSSPRPPSSPFPRPPGSPGFPQQGQMAYVPPEVARMTVPAAKATKRKRHFASDLRHMLYGYGDVETPANDTVEIMEDLVVDYIVDLTKRAAKVAHKRGKLKPGAEDIIFCVRKDPKKLGRVEELLYMNEELKKARKAFDVEELEEDKA